MMQPIPNWENLVARSDDFEQLPAGAYVCTIKAAQLAVAKSTLKMVKLGIDIAEGDFANHYTDMFNARRAANPEVKWPGGAVYYQLYEGEHAERFKGLIETLQKANPGFAWAWDEQKLVGLKFGGIFREEEYRANDGSLRTSVKIYRVVPIEGLGNRKIPEIKRLKINDSFGGEYVRDSDVPF